MSDDELIDPFLDDKVKKDLDEDLIVGDDDLPADDDLDEDEEDGASWTGSDEEEE